MVTKGSFKIDVYDCTVHIIVADDVKRSINHHLKKHDEGSLDHAPSAYCYRPDNGRIGTLYVFFDSEDLSTDMIHHEKSHLIDFILGDRDIRAKNDVRAYLDGFISTKFEKFFSKRKLKVKAKR